MQAKRLHNRTAVVTGASRGLGKAIAMSLASAGARVALVARSLDQLRQNADEIRSLDGEAEAFQADVTSETEIQQLEKDVAAKFGRVQILINNAGINIRKPITDFSLRDWHEVIDTNLTSVFLMCRAFVPHMKAVGGGRIINLTSIMSHVALPHRTAYASSKSALLGFTRALALELASNGITVNGISPGLFDTELNAPLKQDPALHQQVMSKIPVGRWGTADEVGHLAAYLCSDEAAYITGTDILIDGGWCAQ